MHSNCQPGGPQYLDLLLEAVGFHLHYRDIFAEPPLQRRDQRPLIEYFPVPCPREHHDTRLGEATLGALGLPSVRTPDGIEIQPTMMMGLRKALNVYAAVRPIKLYRGVKTPLSTDSDIDFIILRENLEGLFASYGGGSILNDQLATDTQVITRSGTDRISRFAFELSK